MRCYTCGGSMNSIHTDLPFKLDSHRILVVKDVPTEQCNNCGEFLLSDNVLKIIDDLIAATDESVELEVRRYAA